MKTSQEDDYFPLSKQSYLVRGDSTRKILNILPSLKKYLARVNKCQEDWTLPSLKKYLVRVKTARKIERSPH